jgi:hypothetical protein
MISMRPTKSGGTGEVATTITKRLSEEAPGEAGGLTYCADPVSTTGAFP